MSSSELDYISDSINSAASPEDMQAAAELLAEEESKRALRDRFDLITLSEVGEFFGLDEQTIRTWRLKTPAMPGEPGRWPIKRIVQWRCEWIQQTDLAAAKRQQDFELGKIQVETKQIELDREKGLILDRQDVELFVATALVELRETIMQLPEKLAASAPQDLKDFVRSESDMHCRDSLIAASRRLDLMELKKEIVSE